MNDIKLIAIDMDGTLLNSKNQLTDRTFNAINKAQEKGVKVVIATGRVLKSALHYSKELNLDSYVSACNGAIVVDEFSTPVLKKPIGKGDLEKVMELGHSLGIYFHFYNEDTFFTKTLVQEVIDYYTPTTEKFQSQAIGVEIYDNISDIVSIGDLSIYKFLFIDNDKDKLKILREKLVDMDTIDISSSWNNNIEVMAKGASKGNSIEYLCNEFGINRSQVMAIGDNENDLSMIQYAGFGVAMENGEDVVKKAAKYITASNEEDGVAKVIEKFVL